MQQTRPLVRLSKPKRSRGAAVVTALLIVALATTLISGLFWQLQVSLRAVENQRSRAQINWVLRAALDWAGVILRGDARSGKTHLGQAWAIPIPETRLSAYLEKTSKEAFITSDDEEAFLEGRIIDAQSRLNLAALATNGVIEKRERDSFMKLLEMLGADTGLAERAAQFVAETQKGQQSAFNPQGTDKGGAGGSGASLSEGSNSSAFGLATLDDFMAVSGFDQNLITRLTPFCTVLPDSSIVQVNGNTASAEVLAARLAKISLADAKALVAARNKAYFNNSGDMKGVLGPDLLADSDSVMTFNSSYFIVRGKVRLGRARRAIEALVERASNGVTKLVRVSDSINPYAEETL